MADTIANRYVVRGTLGKGAMGAVYRVADTLSGGREVALKLIDVGGPITPAIRLLFKEEFRAMSRLRHPNTIEVYDYGELDDHTQYLTMELVPGEELADSLADPLPFDRIAGLLIQLLQALRFIHARLYIHRDIKAANIRVRPDGQLKLMDFGLMAQLGVPGGKVSGTLGYMAPEIVRGDVLDARTDLYAVGCLAFELACGHLPFQGATVAVVRAHLDQPVPSLLGLRPDVPARYAAMVARLLAKNPAERYADADEVIAELAGIAGIATTKDSLAQKRSYLVAGTLIGREAELATLERALASAKAGRGGAYFVGAPAGVGKSRLVNELTLQAKVDGVTVAHLRCDEGGMAPYEPFVRGLANLVPATPATMRADHGPGLADLFPELAPGAARAAGGSPSAALVGWLRDMARHGPILLVFEDAHWGDARSLETLEALCRQVADVALMVVVTYRSDEMPAGTALLAVVDDGTAHDIALQPLDDAGARRLLTAMLGDVTIAPATWSALYAATGGNPFFLGEVLRSLMEEGLLAPGQGGWRFPADAALMDLPADVEATVVRRLGHLSPAARRLAGVAAVSGRTATRDLLASIADLGEDALFDALQELVERQFLVHDVTGYHFPHDRVREALYADLEEAARTSLHGACGRFMEAAAGEAADDYAAELAHHFALGGGGMPAFRYLRLAGDQARVAGATATALFFWERALEASKGLNDPEVRDARPQLDWQIGALGFEIAPGRAIASFRRWLRWQAGAGADVPEAKTFQAYLFLASAHGFGGQPRDGLAELARASALPIAQDPVIAAGIDMIRALNLLVSGCYDELTTAAAAAEGVLAPIDVSAYPPIIGHCRVGTMSFQNACCYQGIRPSADLQERAMTAAVSIGAMNFQNTIPHYMAIWNAYTGRHQAVLAYIDDTIQNCRKLGAPPHPWVLYLRPLLHVQRGELAEARTLIQRARRYPHLVEAVYPSWLITVLEGQVQVGLGEFVAAAATFDAAERAGREAGLHLITIQALLGRGQLGLAGHNPEGAGEALREAAALCASGPTRNPLHEALAQRLLGELETHQGRLAVARPCLDRAIAIASRPDQDNKLERGHGLRAQGAWYAASRDRQAAGRAYREAGEIFHGLKLPHWLHVVNEKLAGLDTAPLAAQEEKPEDRFMMLKARFM